MKAVILAVTISLVSICASGQVVADTFMGVPIGISVQSSSIESCPDSYVLKGYKPQTMCWDEIGGFFYRGDNKPALHVVKGVFGIHAVYFKFDATDYVTYKAALTEKYGAPIAESDVMKSNEMGQNVPDHTITYRSGTLLVELDSVADHLGEGQVLATSKVLEEREKELHEDAAHKIASQF